MWVMWHSSGTTYVTYTVGDDDGDSVPDTFDNCPEGDTNWLSSISLDSDLDGCRDETEDLDYYSADGTVQDPCENSLAPNCTGPTYNSDVITEESSDEQVRQLVLTTLAIAIVPTVIGILLLAYRMKW